MTKQQRESSTREELATIGLSQFPAPSWVHDFPITKNYAIVPETPIYFNMLVSQSTFAVQTSSAKATLHGVTEGIDENVKQHDVRCIFKGCSLSLTPGSEDQVKTLVLQCCILFWSCWLHALSDRMRGSDIQVLSLRGL